MNSTEDKIWRFIRGDDSKDGFREWLLAEFRSPSLALLLGEDLLLEVLEADYEDPIVVIDVAEHLRSRLAEVNPRTCRCIGWRNQQRIGIGFDPEIGEITSVDEFIGRFDTVKERTPWLSLVRCPQCGQYWYLAVDTIDDDYYLHRLDPAAVERIQAGVWPSDFDSFEPVWPTEEWLSVSGFGSLEDWEANHHA